MYSVYAWLWQFNNSVLFLDSSHFEFASLSLLTRGISSLSLGLDTISLLCRLSNSKEAPRTIKTPAEHSLRGKANIQFKQNDMTINQTTPESFYKLGNYHQRGHSLGVYLFNLPPRETILQTQLWPSFESTIGRFAIQCSNLNA